MPNPTPAGRTPTTLEAAIGYSRAGLVVFPQARDRRAHVRWASLEGPAAPEVLEGWWRRWPEANVALACGPSRVLAVDFDAPHGLAGLERWPWPPTLEAASGGGGVHLLYLCPPGRPMPSGGRSGLLMPGVDVKAAGGCITLPPSVHPRTGALYAWRGLRPPAEAPAFLLELLERERPRPRPAPPPPARLPDADASSLWGRRGLESLCEQIARAPEGERHGRLYGLSRAAGELVAGGELDADEARDALVRAGHLAFEHGKPAEPGEVEQTVRDGLAAGRATPRSRPADTPVPPPAPRGNLPRMPRPPIPQAPRFPR